MPADFLSNEGLAFIVDSPIPSDIPVKCVRLDSAIAAGTTIDLLKVNVEGSVAHASFTIVSV